MLTFPISIYLICYVLLVFTSLSKRTVKNIENNNYTNFIYNGTLLKIENFNYNGRCSEMMKYKSNNERDIILSAVRFDNDKSWKRMKKMVIATTLLQLQSVPYCKKVIIVMSKYIPSDFMDEMSKYDIEIVHDEKPVGYGGIQRIEAYYDYLRKHKSSFERVLLKDISDVFIFGDIFSTFSNTDFILTMECYSNITPNRCVTLAENTNQKWLQNAFGKDVAEYYRRTKPVLINCGQFFGGTDKILGYLKVMYDNINHTVSNSWGYDQALFNHLFRINKMDFLNPTLDKCSMRTCFVDDDLTFNKSLGVLKNKYNGCSPFMRHKTRYNVFNE